MTFEELEIGTVFQWFNGKFYKTFIKTPEREDFNAVILCAMCDNNEGYFEMFSDDQPVYPVSFETY